MSSLAEIEEPHGDYNCCCGFMHVKTGVKAVAGIGLLLIVLSIYGMIASGVPIGPDITSIAIDALAILCLFAALATEKPVFLWPYLILQTLSVIMYIVLLIFMIVYVSTHDDPEVNVTAIIIYTIGIFFPIWYLSIVYGYYKFLKNKTEHNYDNFA